MYVCMYIYIYINRQLNKFTKYDVTVYNEALQWYLIA